MIVSIGISLGIFMWILFVGLVLTFLCGASTDD
jgi:hypothetical protein